MQALKQMRLRKKQEWVSGAQLIMEQRTENSMDRQAERFENYFQGDRG